MTSIYQADTEEAKKKKPKTKVWETMLFLKNDRLWGLEVKERNGNQAANAVYSKIRLDSDLVAM